MKFLQIGENAYINTERIDGVCPDRNGELKVYVGGSDETWTVGRSYVNDVLAFIQRKGTEE